MLAIIDIMRLLLPRRAIDRIGGMD